MARITGKVHLVREIVIETKDTSPCHDRPATVEVKDEAGNVFCVIEAVVVQKPGADMSLCPVVEFREVKTE